MAAISSIVKSPSLKAVTAKRFPRAYIRYLTYVYFLKSAAGDSLSGPEALNLRYPRTSSTFVSTLSILFPRSRISVFKSRYIRTAAPIRAAFIVVSIQVSRSNSAAFRSGKLRFWLYRISGLLFPMASIYRVMITASLLQFSTRKPSSDPLSRKVPVHLAKKVQMPPPASGTLTPRHLPLTLR